MPWHRQYQRCSTVCASSHTGKDWRASDGNGSWQRMPATRGGEEACRQQTLAWGKAAGTPATQAATTSRLGGQHCPSRAACV